MGVPADFTCRRCGACCRGTGEVRLLPGEAEAIAALLGLPLDGFIESFARLREDRAGLALTERADGACSFLDGDSTCRIQAAKPRQCRSFPVAWCSDRLAANCAGIK